MPESNTPQLKQDPKIIQTWMFRKWQEFPSLTFIFVFGAVVSLAIGIFTEFIIYWFLGVFLAMFAVYMMNSSLKSSSLMLSKDQFPRIFEIFERVCYKLGANPNHIRLYIKQSPVYNAFALGIIQKAVILHSSLVDDFTDEELEVVIAHEVAHIVSGHTVFLAFIPRQDIPFLELVTGFYSRNCEYTCDRAAVAVTKNVVSCVTAMLKLCAGAKVSKSIDYTSFGDQIKMAQYDIGVFLAELSSSHPVPVKRIKAILNFAKNHLEKRI